MSATSISQFRIFTNGLKTDFVSNLGQEPNKVNMKHALLALSAISCVFVARPAFAHIRVCESIFDSAEPPPKSELTISDEEIEASLKNGKFTRAKESVFNRVRLTRAKNLLDRLTAMLTGFHAHTYPFSYLRDGSIMKIRRWIKTGDSALGEEIETSIKRYQDYEMDQRLLVERTTFIRTELRLLQSIGRRPKSDFPVAIEMPKYKRKGIKRDSLVFSNKAEVNNEIREIEKSEGLRLDSIWGRGIDRAKFLVGRHQEQAHLEATLRLTLQELKKFPLATRNPELRKNLINEIETALSKESLLAPSSNRYVESRRAFTDELRYFTGHRELSPSGEAAADLLWYNDLFDLGIDRERLDPLSRLGRNMIVKAPHLIIGLMILSYVPTMKHEVKVWLFEESYLQEIAALPNTEYRAQSFEFMKQRYGIQTGGGQLAYSPAAVKALDHLRDLRTEHEAEMRSEHVSQDEFTSALEIGTTNGDITGAQFKNLMTMPISKFKQETVEVAKRQATLALQQSVLARLQTARKDYDEATSTTEHKAGSEGSKTDALINAFSGFVLGDSEEGKPE
jgi:hypothetical protein